MTRTEAIGHALTSLRYFEHVVIPRHEYPSEEFRTARAREISEARAVLRGMS